MTVSVIIFAAREDPFDGYARARLLEAALKRENVEVLFVDRLSSDLEKLMLVAKHRVVKSPTTVILRDGKVTARLLGVPDPSYVILVSGTSS